MFCLCIESSHTKGMGHLFRGLNFAQHLTERGVDFVFAVNDDLKSCRILKEKKVKYEIVNLADLGSGWESELIDKYRITTWIDDRLSTEIEHSSNVKAKGVILVTFDNNGSGANLADLNVAALPCMWKDQKLPGKKLLTGIDCLVLNHDIKNFRRLRSDFSKILVTLGGSDTYGVTVMVAKELINMNIDATILLGPGFKHQKKLAEASGNKLRIKSSVPSLVEEFYNYDLAITGGGLTPFEANASGLPCIIIANELHEVVNAKFLEDTGCSVYAGFRQNFDHGVFRQRHDQQSMSQKGLHSLPLNGSERIFREIQNL